MSDKLAWGLLSTGRIAGTFARGVAHSRTGRVVAVASRSKDKAQAFGLEHDIPRRYGSYEELLADPQVQAVYVATPHPMHPQWAIRAAEAGKHVLCEKPLALNHAGAMAIIDAAADNDVFLMEAYMYRCHPLIGRLVELVRDGAVGEVRLIRASFGFHAGYDPGSRLFSNALGGGGILDVGGYTMSAARLLAGVAVGKDFAEPVSLTATGHVTETGVDDWTVASLKFPGGILAQLATAISLSLDNAVGVFGAAGHIRVADPWIPAREAGPSRILLHRGGKSPEEIVVATDQWLYGIEADLVAANLDRRQAPSPAMSWADTLGNAKALDAWRAAIGQQYDQEKPGHVGVLRGGGLARRADARMKYGQIDGIDKDIARLVMGVDNQLTMPHAAAMFDDYFQRGGNCFDTAYIYGGGTCEKLLGQWVADRGVRRQVVLIAKGAHTPMCTPEGLLAQFDESLQRLQSDHADIYFMHRDNLDVPVGEFVDALNRLKSAGRVRVFGGSNWTLPRIRAANEYAAKSGLTGFGAISNNLSLARMVDPPWAGCLDAKDAEFVAWLTETQTPLMPWSSQARGFFAGRASPDDRSDSELVRCWYAEDNFRRLARAEELAGKLRVPTVAVAGAYVLTQPFPTFPLIGPRTIDETRTSLQALDVDLTERQVKWLNLEA